MSCKVSNLNICYLVDETKQPIKLIFDVDTSNDELIYKLYRFNQLEYTQDVTDDINLPNLKEGVYFHELIWSRNGINRVVFQGNVEIRKKGSEKCNCENSEEKDVIINVDEYIINVSFSGSSESGKDGVGLQYNWIGTELGVKREDELGFHYVDLKGRDGAGGEEYENDLYNIAYRDIKLGESNGEEINVANDLKIGTFQTDGTIDSTKNNWRYFNYDVKGGEVVTYVGYPPVSSSVRQLVAYLKISDGSIIKLFENILTSSTSLKTQEITIPQNGEVYITGRYLAGDKLELYTKSENTDIVGKLIDHITHSNNNLGNVSYCAIGDSLTFLSNGNPNGYTSLLSDYFGFSKTTVNGYSGKSLADSSQGSLLVNKASWTSHDLFSLLTCTNDFKLNTSVGVLDDYINNTGRTTFYGALREFIDRVYELNPNAKIVLIGTGQRNNASYTSWSTNTAGHKLRDYIEALKTVANYESLPFVDLFYEANINMRNVSLYTTDGLHYNDLGYKMITPSIINGIKKIFLI